ncbi:MAG: hypothetical protein KAS67_05930 [Thermoplasmata archaeon]|nr:hypothetical protein [Thermoplasmata archaeon]
MKIITPKIGAMFVSMMLLLSATFFVWGTGSASEVYETDGEVHQTSWGTIPAHQIDGEVTGEWPLNSIIGNLWCTEEESPVGDVYVINDLDYIYICAQVTRGGAAMADDGQGVKIDWNRDGIIDLKDNMGNSQDVIFSHSPECYEYAIPMDAEIMEDGRLDILIHAEMVGLPSSPDGETTTFPYRTPGKFLSTTLVIAGEPDVEELPEVIPDEEPDEIPDLPEEIPDELPIDEPASPPENPNFGYWIEYLDPADQTIVNESGIWFHTSGNYPEQLTHIPFNQTFVIPEKDYGVYPLYNHSNPVQFRIHITNQESVAIEGLEITAIQERHNDVTIWDYHGQMNLFQGQWLAGDPVEMWSIASIEPGETICLDGTYDVYGRGWGLDQTHLKISVNGNLVVDDSEAGVYCPP